MNGWEIALVCAGGFCGGAMNAVAGGGTFFSFPALLAVGLPPIIANASNSVALWPASLSGAWAYRKELGRHTQYLIPMCIVSFVGGAGGGLLLLSTQNATFSLLIPWLLLFATLLFAFSNRISLWMQRARIEKRRNDFTAVAAQGVVSIYGGFFGAGMGILMLASLAISGHDDMQEINAIKNLLSAVIYSVTVLTFVIAGAVSWPYTAIMLVAATLGGYWGASIARRIPEPWLRRFIISTGSALSAFYFYRIF